MRCGGLAFAPERLRDSSRSGGRHFVLAPILSLFVIPLSLHASFRGRGAARGSFQWHAGAPGLRETGRDSLSRRSRSMLAFPDVIEFFPHEFAGLCAGGFALARIFFRSLDHSFFGHVAIPDE